MEDCPQNQRLKDNHWEVGYASNWERHDLHRDFVNGAGPRSSPALSADMESVELAAKGHQQPLFRN